MDTTNPPMKTRSIRVSDEDWHTFKQLALDQRTTISALIRDAVAAYPRTGEDLFEALGVSLLEELVGMLLEMPEGRELVLSYLNRSMELMARHEGDGNERE